MPVRVPLITDPAPRVLLDGLVDYAGLFPPSALSMAEAVRNFARYRGGEAGWMLGRFVCAVPHFDAFIAAAEPLLPRDAGALPWRLAAVGTGDHTADAAAIARMNECHRWSMEECSAVVDVIETRVGTLDEVLHVHEAFPADVLVYLELPAGADPVPFLQRIANTGRRAKLRTGGVMPEAFPTPEAVFAFLDACIASHVPFKATAGLHHALQGRFPLTYEAQSATAPMFGFLNIFLAAALRAAEGSREQVLQLLQESDASSIAFSDESVAWRGHVLHRTHLARVREEIAVSFGSCSFTEPVTEVRAMGAW
jgi:hypothetical protein